MPASLPGGTDSGVSKAAESDARRTVHSTGERPDNAGGRVRLDAAQDEELFPIGAPVRIEHRKPWKRTVTSVGKVASYRDGLLTIARTFAPGGRYDSLGDKMLPGDHGTVEVVEGGWVLRRTYRRADGRLIGELYNIQTPAEFAPGVVCYTHLEVDVARFADGRVQVVDEQDLAVVVRAGAISRELADSALAIAQHLADVLRVGGDWRSLETGLGSGSSKHA